MNVRLTLFLVLFWISTGAFGQGLSCASLNEQPGYNEPEFTMSGCRSFVELNDAGGIKLIKAREMKNYACFATKFPDEMRNMFLTVSIGGVMDFGKDQPENGRVKLTTYSDGIKINEGFTNIRWTQYPASQPFIWSEGDWTGHGDAELMTWSEDAKSLVPKPDSEWKRMHIPQLHATIQDDTVELRLDINNEHGAVEKLSFNHRTGRSVLTMGEYSQSIRCFSID